jgi:hypothetical protein
MYPDKRQISAKLKNELKFTGVALSMDEEGKLIPLKDKPADSKAVFIFPRQNRQCPIETGSPIDVVLPDSAVLMTVAKEMKAGVAFKFDEEGRVTDVTDPKEEVGFTLEASRPSGSILVYYAHL